MHVLSKNSKTGVSLNVSVCQPTRWCYQHCYAHKGGGVGPITLKSAQTFYYRNTVRVQTEPLSKIADEIVGDFTRVKKKYPMISLRGNGVGDLFTKLTELYHILARRGIPIFLFSRIPKQIEYLADLCSDIPYPDRPFVIGSVDPSTPLSRVDELERATKKINGFSSLAYACEDEQGEIDYLKNLLNNYSIYTVFGYHRGKNLTSLSDKYEWVRGLECPATRGDDTTCLQCRRCYSPYN